MRRILLAVPFFCACVSDVQPGMEAGLPDATTGTDSMTAMDGGGGGDAAMDGGGGTGFCNAHPTARFCEDFDLNNNFRPGWMASGGAMQLSKTMPRSTPNVGTSSTPQATMSTSTVAHAVNVAGATQSWRVDAWVRLDSYQPVDAAAPGTGGARVLYLNIGATDYVTVSLRPWALAARCFAVANGNMAINFNNQDVPFAINFWHSVSIEVTKANPYAVTCTIDQTTLGPYPAPFPAIPNSVDVTIGLNVNVLGSPVGATKVSFDDLLVLAQ